jgi:hypothetical protein
MVMDIPAGVVAIVWDTKFQLPVETHPLAFRVRSNTYVQVDPPKPDANPKSRSSVTLLPDPLIDDVPE